MQNPMQGADILTKAVSKRKIDQIAAHDALGVDEDGGLIVEEESISNNHKLKLGPDNNLAIQIKDMSNEDHVDLSAQTSSINPSEPSTSDSQDLSFSDKLNSISMDDGNDDDDDDVDEVACEYMEDDDFGDDDAEDEEDEDDDGYDLSLDSQFDSKYLPPGVEASFPWLTLGAASSTFTGQPCLMMDLEAKDNEILKKFRDFKHFDTVTDYSDHYFTDPWGKNGIKYSPLPPKDDTQEGSFLTNKTPKDWSKQIQKEWKILEDNLPDSIFVRAYEGRMDLMRAVIVGSGGTPYHDGLFFFDMCFPSDYPSSPPCVHYHSGGLRLNPNLYDCGKVCLSLLNTWHGQQKEKWTPGTSTMLQVLVSILGLVLNAKPYFNEPGYEKFAGKPDGERKALQYSENAFLLSLKTMMYTLRNPPKHFEDFVRGHYHQHAHTILGACKAYMDGARVGFPSGPRSKDETKDSRRPETFKEGLKKLFPKLLVAFTDNGADCRQFLPQKDESKSKAVN